MITRNVLFLCTGNYYRSRFAEEYFNYLAKINSLDWRADSRGLAADITELRNPGPVSKHALLELEKRNILPENANRFPLKASYDDFEKAVFIIALNRNEHQSLLRQNFPEFNGVVE